MAQDEYGHEIGLEDNRPPQERARALQGRLGTLIQEVDDLMATVKKYAVFDDQQNIDAFVALKQQAQAILEAWGGKMKDPATRAPAGPPEHTPAKQIMPVGFNEHGGVVFDMSVKVGNKNA